MKFYQNLSLLFAFLIGLIIFSWSNIPGSEGPTVSISFLAILYHFGIFFLFSAFLFLSFWSMFSKGNIFLIFVLSVLYGCLDELHQHFIPGRTAGVFDFSIDLAGIVVGLVFVMVCRKFRK